MRTSLTTFCYNTMLNIVVSGDYEPIPVFNLIIIVTLYFSLNTQRVLNMMGNPVIKKIKNYRKTMVLRLVSLTL